MTDKYKTIIFMQQMKRFHIRPVFSFGFLSTVKKKKKKNLTKNCSHCVAIESLRGSHQVPTVFPHLFSTTPNFYPICFGQIWTCMYIHYGGKFIWGSSYVLLLGSSQHVKENCNGPTEIGYLKGKMLCWLFIVANFHHFVKSIL